MNLPEDPINLPDVITSEFILASVRLVQVQNFVIQTMYAVGVEERRLRGMDDNEAAKDYFGSATNAKELWGTLEFCTEVYTNLFRIASEEMSNG